MDRETSRELRRIERELGLLHEEDRLLRERISIVTGDFSSEFFAQAALNGILGTGDGISGGGTFPGTVSVAIDLSATSGLEFSSGELQIADSVAGSGLTISSKILAVNVGNGLEVSGDAVLVDIVDAWSGLEFSSADLRVNLGAAFTWTAQHTFQNDPGVIIDPQSDIDINLWQVNVTGTPTLKWDESEDALSQSHDIILEKRCFGFLKSQDKDGRVGNGPVEYGEVFGVGGVLEVSAACAVYESVVIS